MSISSVNNKKENIGFSFAWDCIPPLCSHLQNRVRSGTSLAMINFNQVRVFYEVASEGSLKAASEKLFVSQSAISVMLRSFEDFCDLVLFKRIGRRLILTETGHILLQSCRQVFEQEKDLERAISDLHQLRIGIIKIGTSKTYAQHVMPPLINCFHSQYPTVKIVLDEGTSMQIGRSLLKSQNELAIIAKTEELNGVEFIPFKSEEIVLFSSPHHSFAKRAEGIRFSELKAQPIIMRDEGSGTRRVVDEAYGRHGIRPHILLETGNRECITDMVAKGEGVSFLVQSSLIEDFEKHRLQMIPIIDEKLHLDVKIAYLRDQPLSQAAKAFLKLFVGDAKKKRS